MPYYPPGGGGAPTTAEYVVGASDGTLSAERVVTDTTGNTGVTWDLATGGQAKATATNAGKWIKLATATASSSASVAFTGLSSSYAAYKIVLSHVAPATDSVALWIRTSTDGGSTYDSGAGNYAYVYNVWVTGAAAQTGSAGDTKIATIDTMGNATNETISGEVTIFNPSAAKFGVVGWTLLGTQDTGAQRYAIGGGRRLAAADVDAIQFLMSSGNIASGNFDLYGLAN